MSDMPNPTKSVRKVKGWGIVDALGELSNYVDGDELKFSRVRKEAKKWLDDDTFRIVPIEITYTITKVKGKRV